MTKAKFERGDVVTGVTGEKYVLMDRNGLDWKVVSIDDVDLYENGDISQDVIAHHWISEYDIKRAKVVPWTVASGWRRDRGGFKDFEFVLAAAGTKRILTAGCRTFVDTDEARKHWQNKTGYYNDYPDIDGYRTDLNERSVKLVNRLERKVEKNV